MVTTIEKFISHLNASGYADATIRIYSDGLRVFCRFLENNDISDLREVSEDIIEKYRLSLIESGLNRNTVALRFNVVVKLFDHLERTSKLLINPTRNMKRLAKQRNKIGPVLTQRQIKRLMSVPHMKNPVGIRNRAIMELLYSTGIRLGELLGLQMQDLDLKESVIFIRRGKGARQRVVPVGKQAVKYLIEYLNKVRPFHLAGKHTEILFLTIHGNPSLGESIRLFLRRYRKKAGIQVPVSPHVFRRTCATHFLRQGANIRFVQQLLGHKNLRVTHRYTKVLPKELKRTHEKTHPGVDDESD